MIGSETYLDLLKSGPHWLFEITTDVAFFIAGLLWVKAHDIRKHSGHTSRHEKDDQ